MRLTLLYGALFLLCGTGLLGITYVLFERATRIKGPLPQFPSPGQVPDHATIQTDRPTTLGEEIKRAADLHQLLVNSGIALAILVLVALLLGWYVAGRMLHPLRTITATARSISANNLHERLSLSGPNDELKDLGDTFDDLLGRLQHSWDSQRQFIANVSHELRSPLTRLRLRAEIAATDPDATIESLQAGYQSVIAAAQQQEKLIAALLSLARGQRGLDHTETFDLAPILHDILHTQRQHTQPRGLHITTDITPAPVTGDPQLVQQLIRNLIDNAILHNTDGGQIQLATATHAGRSVLTVSNDGPTIPPTDLERLFRPFERLEPGRRHHKTGHGLGLSIVEAIATAHSAVITARSRPAGGLSVDITFPQADHNPPDTARIAAARPPGQPATKVTLAQPTNKDGAVPPVRTPPPSENRS